MAPENSKAMGPEKSKAMGPEKSKTGNEAPVSTVMSLATAIGAGGAAVLVKSVSIVADVLYGLDEKGAEVKEW